jgi:hypothetical protein
MIVVPFPIRPKNFLFVTVSLPNLKSTIFFFRNLSSKLSAEVNRLERDMEHTLPSNSEVEKFRNIPLFSLRLLCVVLNYAHPKFFLLNLSLRHKCFLGKQLRQIYYLKSNFNSLHQLLEHGLFCYATHCTFMCFINILRTLLF